MEDNQEEVLEFISSEWKDALERAKEQFNVQLSAEQLADAFSNVETWAEEQNKRKSKRRRLNKKNTLEEQVSTFMIDSRTLEEKVFGNHLLSTKIFGHLKKTDLLKCRLVHPRWKESIIIGKNGDGIVFSKVLNRFYLGRSNWKSLDMFTEFLKFFDSDSCSFPCVGYEFDGGNIGNDDAQRFFEFFGPSIRNLNLDMKKQTGQRWNQNFVKPKNGFSKYWTDPTFIRKLLCRQAPNIQELSISFPSNGNWPGYKKLLFSSETSKETKIPNLISIKYSPSGMYPGETDSAILSQLLNAANNLKKFELRYGNSSILGKYLGVIVAAGKSNTIKKLIFAPSTENEISSFEKFATSGPQLENMSLDLEKINRIPQLWSKLSVLSSLFKSSQHSLNNMNFLGSLGFLPSISIPQFENVKTIKLKVTSIRGKNNNSNATTTTTSNDAQDNTKEEDTVNQIDNSCLFLPYGVNFSDIFPALHSIKIEMYIAVTQEQGLPFWTKYFPMDDSLPTVKILEITPWAIPPFWVEKFGEMFPNLEKLTLKEVKDFPAVAAVIWSSYKQLTDLELELNMSKTANSGRVLDKAFTGFTTEQLDNSRKTLPKAKDASSLSILKMKNLRVLRLNFNYQRDIRTSNNYKVLCLNVGKDYLNKLKNLSMVTISISNERRQAAKITGFKKALKELKKYKVKVLSK